MKFRKNFFGMILVIFVVVTACKDSNQTEASKPEGEKVYKPVSKETCQSIRSDVEKALNTKFSISEKSLDGYILKGTACYMKVNGTAANFDLVDSTNAITATLAGWEQDIQLAAGGPTGTMGGYRKDNTVVIVSVNWEKSADANCPNDKPIDDCVLTPEQKLYTIEVFASQN